jgi:AcrR family transcriptional regulator
MTAPRKPGRPKGSISPEISAEIIRAAGELFLAKGFDGVSMAQVAASVGVPKTTVYKRHPDKKALLRAVIEARREQWSRDAARGDSKLTQDVRERLTYYGGVVLRFACSSEVRAFRALAAAAWSRPEEAGDRLDLIGLTGMLDLLERDIREYGPQAGVTPRDARRVATVLMATLAGWLENRSAGAPPTDQEASDFARDAVDLLLRGSAAW